MECTFGISELGELEKMAETLDGLSTNVLKTSIVIGKTISCCQ